MIASAGKKRTPEEGGRAASSRSREQRHPRGLQNEGGGLSHQPWADELMWGFSPGRSVFPDTGGERCQAPWASVTGSKIVLEEVVVLDPRPGVREGWVSLLMELLGLAAEGVCAPGNQLSSTSGPVVWALLLGRLLQNRPDLQPSGTCARWV